MNQTVGTLGQNQNFTNKLLKKELVGVTEWLGTETGPRLNPSDQTDKFHSLICILNINSTMISAF